MADLDAKTLRRKGDKFVSGKIAIGRYSERNNNFIPKNFLLSNQEIDNSCTSRHSERKRKNPADYNSKQLQGKKNNSTETVFSRFTSHVSLPKVAFTLAEVLITLGIIGVVAALTLPSVINKYHSFVLEQQFKKSKQLLNGIGCSWYALNNIDPDDNSKKYWDSLPW